MMPDPAVQELLDKAAIRDLMARYARGIDRRDKDLIASTFSSDAYASYVDWERTGLDNIVERLGAGCRSSRSTHFMGDQEVRLNGDAANVETYAVAYSVRAAGDAQSLAVTGLRYVDKMVRQDGRWLVQHRVLHIDWRTSAPLDESVPGTDRLPISE